MYRYAYLLELPVRYINRGSTEKKMVMVHVCISPWGTNCPTLGRGTSAHCRLPATGPRIHLAQNTLQNNYLPPEAPTHYGLYKVKNVDLRS